LVKTLGNSYVPYIVNIAYIPNIAYIANMANAACATAQTLDVESSNF
jgi:hypothetical protein